MEKEWTERNWGRYRVIEEFGKEFKVKEIEVNPQSKLSMQRHQYRNEYWMVIEGNATIYTLWPDNDGNEQVVQRGSAIWPAQTTATINKGEWHQLTNDTDEPLRILEVQYGETCIEEDIERITIL